MKASVLPRYLLGSRTAILEVASSRWSLLIGAIFVLSAGFAREYDGEDLVHEPWHALRPLGASLVSGTLLFLVAHGAALSRRQAATGTPPAFLSAWRTFLGLFWMTAPMAWAYAIPYERFMTPVNAIEVNLWTLAVVAAWRVVLMTQVIRVVYGIGITSSFFLVMLFADIVVFAVIMIAPTPVIEVMGGIRHDDREALIAGVTVMVIMLAVLTAPIWILGALVAMARLTPRWPVPQARTSDGSLGLLFLAIGTVLAFAPLLVLTQPEQMNRCAAERLLTGTEVDAGLRLMSSMTPDAYPPHWNPPPRLGYREKTPGIAALREAMINERPADWVLERYLPKLDRALRLELVPWGGGMSWSRIMERFEDPDTFYKLDPDLGATAQFLLDLSPDLSDADREALGRLATLHVEGGYTGMPEIQRELLFTKAIQDGNDDAILGLLMTDLSADALGAGLHAAARTNDPEVSRRLLDRGADLEWSGEHASLVSPAHTAAFAGSNDALEALLDAGADPHVGSEQYGSLIFAAAFEGNRETVRLLLERDLGIDLQAARASDRATPLHFAYWNNDQQMVRLLLDAGADPDATTSDGRTPARFGR